MTTIRKVLKLSERVLAVVLLGYFGYFGYSMATGEDRMRQVCAQIAEGMTIAEVNRFAVTHGLGPGSIGPGRKMAYLAEIRSFGRHACKVELAEDRVVRAEYNYAD